MSNIDTDSLRAAVAMAIAKPQFNLAAAVAAAIPNGMKNIDDAKTLFLSIDADQKIAAASRGAAVVAMTLGGDRYAKCLAAAKSIRAADPEIATAEGALARKVGEAVLKGATVEAARNAVAADNNISRRTAYDEARSFLKGIASNGAKHADALAPQLAEADAAKLRKALATLEAVYGKLPA